MYNYHQRKISREEIYTNTLDCHMKDTSFISSKFSSIVNIRCQNNLQLKNVSPNISSGEIPMDVDLDDSMCADNDISINECTETHSCINENGNFYKSKNVSNTNHPVQHLETKIKQLKNNKLRKSYVSILSALLMALVSYYIFMNYIGLNESSDVQNIIEELKASVLFQDEAVDAIIENVRCIISNTECRKIMLFIGSTGVGKTFVANIIKKHFPGNSVHEISARWLNKVHVKEKTLDGVNEGVCNLIIMDNLKSNNVEAVLKFIKGLPNISCLFVIPIFNIQETSDNLLQTIIYDEFENIPMKFRISGMIFEPILFNIIEEHVLETWLEKLLVARKCLETPYSIIKAVLQQHDVRYYGFKGLQAKLNLLLNQCEND